MKNIELNQMANIKGASARDCWNAVIATSSCLPISSILASSCIVAGLSWF